MILSQDVRPGSSAALRFVELSLIGGRKADSPFHYDSFLILFYVFDRFRNFCELPLASGGSISCSDGHEWLQACIQEL